MLVENVPTIVAAACVLHNICEVHKVVFAESWLSVISDDTSSQPQAVKQDSGSSEELKEIRNVATSSALPFAFIVIINFVAFFSSYVHVFPQNFMLK